MAAERIIATEAEARNLTAIQAPTLDELADGIAERSLRQRDTESAGEIEERVRVAKEQLDVAPRFDHVVENDDLERAGEELAGIVARELNHAATMSGR